MDQKLDNKEYVFTLLTAIIKKHGGEIRLTEDVIRQVYNSDVISLLWDEQSKEVVLRSTTTTPDYTSPPDKNIN